MQKEEQCSVKIYDRRMGACQCQKKAKVVRDGKPYCTIHDPEYIKRKQEKQNKQWDEERAEKQKIYDRNDAMRAATEGLTTEELQKLNPNLVGASRDMYEALKAARAFLTFAESRDNPLPGATEVKNVLEQAIAKAEGNEA